jgi:hypothetical protein
LIYFDIIFQIKFLRYGQVLRHAGKPTSPRRTTVAVDPLSVRENATLPVVMPFRFSVPTRQAAPFTCPVFARGREFKDVQAYQIAGSGIARTVRYESVVSTRQRFLPGFCMMQPGHMVVVKIAPHGSRRPRVRAKDVRI